LSIFVDFIFRFLSTSFFDFSRLHFRFFLDFIFDFPSIFIFDFHSIFRQFSVGQLPPHAPLQASPTIGCAMPAAPLSLSYFRCLASCFPLRFPLPLPLRHFRPNPPNFRHQILSFRLRHFRRKPDNFRAAAAVHPRCWCGFRRSVWRRERRYKKRPSWSTYLPSRKKSSFQKELQKS
jgi:hypothetical protein